MKQRYLQVTYENGRALAAYLYLPREIGVKSARVEPAGRGILVDYAASGKPIGVEITAPLTASLAEINSVLKRIGERPLSQREWRTAAA